eukprot:6458317-Amphidinium_carterae.1
MLSMTLSGKVHSVADVSKKSSVIVLLARVESPCCTLGRLYCGPRLELVCKPCQVFRMPPEPDGCCSDFRPSLP